MMMIIVVVMMMMMLSKGIMDHVWSVRNMSWGKQKERKCRCRVYFMSQRRLFGIPAIINNNKINDYDNNKSTEEAAQASNGLHETETLKRMFICF